MPSTSPAPRAVTGVVLAGGRGLRMGGVDKGLLSYRGQTLAQHQLAILAAQVDAAMISANRNLDRYADMGVRVVPDADDSYAGPLAGMLAGLRAASTAWIACLPCDTLGFPENGVQRLLDAAFAAGAPAAYARDAGGPQYTVCVLHRGLAGALDAALSAGQRTVQAFWREQHAVVADLSDCVLANCNTPEALAC